MSITTLAIYDTLYQLTSISHQDKITSIAGLPVELYVTAIEPVSQGSHYRFRVLAPTPIVITRFSHIDPITREPIYFAEETVYGQVKTIKGSVWKTESLARNAIDGSHAPQSKTFIYFDNADNNQAFGTFRAIVNDEARGLLFNDLYSVNYIPAPIKTGGDPDLMIPPTLTPSTPINLEYIFLEQQEQYLFLENQTVRVGDAILKISRDKLTLSEITTEGAIFTVTEQNQPTVRYQIWEKTQGIQSGQTYHWTIYLNKIKGQI